MPEGLITVAYIVSGVLFILSLRGLSNQETAKRGNLYGAAGMIIAVLATILGGRVGSLGTLMLVMLVGGGIGLFAARRVAMTAMPELVAILHSFVGAAAVLVGIVSHLESAHLSGTELLIHEIEIVLGVFIGAYTYRFSNRLSEITRKYWRKAVDFSFSALLRLITGIGQCIVWSMVCKRCRGRATHVPLDYNRHSRTAWNSYDHGDRRC